MSWRGRSAESGVSSPPSNLVSRVEDLHEMYDSPLTNQVIMAFRGQSVPSAGIVTSPTSSGAREFAHPQPTLFRYGHKNSPPSHAANTGTIRNITIGEFSAPASRSPSRAQPNEPFGATEREPRSATATRPTRPMVNAITRDEALAPYPIGGIPDAYAPAQFSRRAVRPGVIARPPVPPLVDDGDAEDDAHPDERRRQRRASEEMQGGGIRWAPVARVLRRSEPREEEDAYNRRDALPLNEAALRRLQHHLTINHRERRSTSRRDEEDPEQSDEDDLAVRHRSSQPRDAGAPQRNQQTDDEVEYLTEDQDDAEAPEVPQDTRTQTYIPEQVAATLREVIELLSMISRRPAVPQAPPHVMHAYFRKVAAGAYFVKYPQRGSPHQRFFRLHVIANEIYGRQPYMEYSTHATAVSVKGRMHLAHLVGLNAGVGQSPNFARFIMKQPDGTVLLQGPLYDGGRTTLNGQYAFTLVFVTSQQRDLFSMLTLDEETYHCWLIVLQFLASVNVHFDDTRPGPESPMQPLDSAPVRLTERPSSS